MAEKTEGGREGVRNKVARKDRKERETYSHPNRGAERRNTETRDEQSKETIRSEFEQQTAAGRVVSLVRLVADELMLNVLRCQLTY